MSLEQALMGLGPQGAALAIEEMRRKRARGAFDRAEAGIGSAVGSASDILTLLAKQEFAREQGDANRAARLEAIREQANLQRRRDAEAFDRAEQSRQSDRSARLEAIRARTKAQAEGQSHQLKARAQSEAAKAAREAAAKEAESAAAAETSARAGRIDEAAREWFKAGRPEGEVDDYATAADPFGVRDRDETAAAIRKRADELEAEAGGVSEREKLDRKEAEGAKDRAAAQRRAETAASALRPKKPLSVGGHESMAQIGLAKGSLGRFRGFMAKEAREGGFTASGPVAGRAQRFWKWIGGGTERRNEFDRLRTEALQSAGRLFEGGKLTDADYARYEQAFASDTISPQEILANIDALERDVAEYEAQLTAGLGTSYALPEQSAEPGGMPDWLRDTDDMITVVLPDGKRKMMPADRVRELWPRLQAEGIRVEP